MINGKCWLIPAETCTVWYVVILQIIENWSNTCTCSLVPNITTKGRNMLNIYDDYAKIDDNVRVADNVRIGYWAKIGDNVTIGDNVRIADWAEIGYSARIGSKFRCEGLKVIDFFTMANVDGTGRRIHIYVHTEGIAVRAGCFIDTLDEFCWKAEQEEKYLYSVTVRAAAEAFADEVHRQGKTGGWDKKS